MIVSGFWIPMDCCSNGGGGISWSKCDWRWCRDSLLCDGDAECSGMPEKKNDAVLCF